MWNWFSCYLSGRHDYGMWCEPGTIYLRCMHCGRRSSGWDVNTKPVSALPSATVHKHHRPVLVEATAGAQSVSSSRVIPFSRATAS